MSSFKQISDKQRESLIESNARINIWEGSVRSGKTFISLWRFLEELSKGPEGEYALIARTYDSFKRNVLPQLATMIGYQNLNHLQGRRELNIYGKIIHVIGADDERAESKIRGPTFAGAYVDEATIIPESVFKMLISRCAMGGAKIFATTNPDSPYHWFKTGFLNGNPDVKSWQFRLEDNPQLSQDEREYLKRQYTGLWYQRFIEGQWVQAEGTIYDFFEEKYHVIDTAPSYTASYIVGCDYGTTNPCAFVLIGIDTSKFPNMWVEDEYYFDSRVHQRQKTDSEYAEDLKRFIQGRSVVGIYLDPSAVSFRMELFKQGISNLYEAENDVLNGIAFVRKLMGNGTFKILRNCKNTIKEIQSYVWDKNSHKTGIDKPKKENDHCCDAIRYCLFTHKFGKEGSRLSPKDIDQMYNESRGMDVNLPKFFQDSDNKMY
jgi:PBSX family phage terminase large subunit